MRFSSCDSCDRTAVAIFEHCTTRPSDPSSLCCIMAMCARCGGEPDLGGPLPADRVPGVGTYDQLATWVECHGHRHGIAFYE